MAQTLVSRGIRPIRCFAYVACLLLAIPRPGLAQSGSLGDALLNLWKSTDQSTATAPNGGTVRSNQLVTGRLYGASVEFQVDNRDGNDHNLGTDDRVIRFVIGRGTNQLTFTPPGGATRDEFTQWATANARDLIAILFPTSISQSVSGRDAAQNYSQQFLLNTALGASVAEQSGRLRRSDAGGLFEFENMSGDGRSGVAIQGLYRMEGVHMSVLGRYVQQREGVNSPAGAAPVTHSVSLATDYHPSVPLNRDLDFRVGINARGGLLVSRVNTLEFGSFDYGGGVWTSARKDFSRVRLGVGSMLQGSRSYVPTALVGDLDFLASAINKRPIAWDVTYGAIGGFALTDRASLNGKVLQTRTLRTAGDERLQTSIVMGSVSYLIGGLTPVDVGYKYLNSGDIRAHSIFLQGHFGW